MATSRVAKICSARSISPAPNTGSRMSIQRLTFMWEGGAARRPFTSRSTASRSWETPARTYSDGANRDHTSDGVDVNFCQASSTKPRWKETMPKHRFPTDSVVVSLLSAADMAVAPEMSPAATRSRTSATSPPVNERPSRSAAMSGSASVLVPTVRFSPAGSERGPSGADPPVPRLRLKSSGETNRRARPRGTLNIELPQVRGAGVRRHSLLPRPRRPLRRHRARSMRW